MPNGRPAWSVTGWTSFLCTKAIGWTWDRVCSRRCLILGLAPLLVRPAIRETLLIDYKGPRMQLLLQLLQDRDDRPLILAE